MILLPQLAASMDYACVHPYNVYVTIGNCILDLVTVICILDLYRLEVRHVIGTKLMCIFVAVAQYGL